MQNSLKHIKGITLDPRLAEQLPSTTKNWKNYWPEALILAIACILRVCLITIKPPHFDEGINGWFIDQMQQTGFYAYDPKNYHGPWYFYLLFLSINLLGHNLFALRLPAIVGSICGVLALFGFKNILGRPAVLIAAFALAVSPAATFYGRYSIHESWFTTFSILFILGILGVWKFRTVPYLVALFAGITGMLLTKETVIIHAGSALLAFPTLWLFNRLSPANKLNTPKATYKREVVTLGICISLLILLLVYSGFFLNPKGVLDFLMGKAAWVETGVEKSGHSKPWFYWLNLMRVYEWATLLGVVLCSRYLLPSNKLPRYLTIYATGVLVAYSIVSYKTPWCILPIQWPFLLILGVTIAEYAKTRSWLYCLPVLVILGNIPTTIRLNFFDYDNEREPYVYVQTFRDFNSVINPIILKAQQDPRLYQIGGVIALDSYYPLPWVFGQFQKIAYDQNLLKKDGVVSIPPTIDLIIFYEKEKNAYEEAANGEFYSIPFRLRASQAQCRLLLRKNLGIKINTENIKK